MKGGKALLWWLWRRWKRMHQIRSAQIWCRSCKSWKCWSHIPMLSGCWVAALKKVREKCVLLLANLHWQWRESSTVIILRLLVEVLLLSQYPIKSLPHSFDPLNVAEEIITHKQYEQTYISVVHFENTLKKMNIFHYQFYLLQSHSLLSWNMYHMASYRVFCVTHVLNVTMVTCMEPAILWHHGTSLPLCTRSLVAWIFSLRRGYVAITSSHKLP